MAKGQCHMLCRYKEDVTAKAKPKLSDTWCVQQASIVVMRLVPAPIPGSSTCNTKKLLIYKLVLVKKTQIVHCLPSSLALAVLSTINGCTNFRNPILPNFGCLVCR